MEFIGVIAVFVGMLVVANFKKIFSNDIDYDLNSAEVKLLKKTCKVLNLTTSRDGTESYGTIDQHRFLLKIESESIFSLFVYHELPVEGQVTIRRENLSSKIKRNIGKGDILIGDSSFDDVMLLRSENAVEVTALLNSKNRIMITELSEDTGSFSVSSEGIKANFDVIKFHPNMISRFVKDMIAASKSLCQKSDIRNMLIKNTLSDPEPGVRINNLRMLALHYSLEQDLVYAVLESLKDFSMDMQVEAASLLQEEGMEHLVGILKRNEKTSDTILLKIIELIHENCYSKGAEVLKEIYNIKGQEIRIAVLKAFETFGETALAPFLAERLNVQDNALLVSLFRALGTCGTVNEIERIGGLAKIIGHANVRKEARKAIALIQDRYGVDKGWLSVAEYTETDGALSMANEDAEGGLSFTKEKNNQK